MLAICMLWHNILSQHIFNLVTGKQVTVQMESEIGIVGGGLTGVMMAVTLSHSSDSVTLITKALLSPKYRQDDNRTTTIHAAGKAMLEALGVWENLPKPPVPVTRIMVAEGPSPAGLAERRQQDFGLTWHDAEQPMAYVVDNAALLDALRDNLATRSVRVIQPATVTGIGTVAGKARLACADRKLPYFDLVIACDGAKSPLRDSTHLRHFTASHRQTAIVGSLRLERDHENTAFQRLLPDGPIALMPSGDRLASLVWTMPKTAADTIMAASDEAFNQACNAAFGTQLGAMEIIGARLAWPLQPTWMPRLGTDHLLFAGDAGHHLHPLAGQGYNLALADAAILADCISRAHRRGLAADHPSVRQDYQRGRQVEIAAMTAVTSGLNMIMSYAPNPVAKIAGMGMSLINASPAKNLFRSIARGNVLARASLLSGRLPN
jgi:2-octaprenyl-6-methoxyphenol hydroxylase